MRQRLLAAMVAGSLLIGGSAMAAGKRGKDDPYTYSQRGAIEADGGLSAAWTKGLFSLDIAPRIGYFLVDRFQLSALFDLTYIKPGHLPYSLGGTLQAEPSYHMPILKEDRVFLFAGLGVGVGFNGRNGSFELSPRAGANVLFGRAGVLTPAIRVPILFHSNPSTLVGIQADISIGTVF